MVTIIQHTPVDYIPVLMQGIVVIGFIAAVMLATHYLGPSRKTKRKLQNFECGIEQIGNARSPFSVKYFLIAILFVLFDVEVIFMYPWAVNFKELGAFGFWEMLIFMGFLLSGFLYLLLKGAFTWDRFSMPEGHKKA